MIGSMLAGAGIVVYLFGVVLITFMGLVGGADGRAFLFGLVWPIGLPYIYIDNRIRNWRYRREKEKKQ